MLGIAFALMIISACLASHAIGWADCESWHGAEPAPLWRSAFAPLWFYSGVAVLALVVSRSLS